MIYVQYAYNNTSLKEMKINVRHTTPLLHPLPLSSLYCRQYISQNNPVGRRIRSEQLPQVANIP